MPIDPMDELKNIAIDKLIGLPAGEWLGKAVETVSSVQKILFAISENGDSNELTLLKIGTVFQIFLIDTLAGGKRPEDLTEEDWHNIADKVAQYAVFEDEQSYSEFVFKLYADFIEISSDKLRSKKVSEENVEKVKAIADEIRLNTERFRNEELSEVDYVDNCLWLSLEGMIKCLSLSLTSLVGPEFAQLAQAVSQLAFEYGRYMLYTKEQAILQSYIDNQHILDERLQREYEAYLAEVNERAARFKALVDDAFSPNLKESLMQSVALAREAGVREEELLKSIQDIDDFFM